LILLKKLSMEQPDSSLQLEKSFLALPDSVILLESSSIELPDSMILLESSSIEQRDSMMLLENSSTEQPNFFFSCRATRSSRRPCLVCGRTGSPSSPTCFLSRPTSRRRCSTRFPDASTCRSPAALC
jgi:hypothetical protein